MKIQYISFKVYKEVGNEHFIYSSCIVIVIHDSHVTY